MAKTIVDVQVGDKFNRLTLVSVPQVKMAKWGKRLALVDVRCDCGAIRHDVPLSFIKRGHTKSCGCLRLEGEHIIRPTHGMSKTNFYWCWLGMRNRSTGVFPGYEGVGHDPRWDTFETFLADMGPTYFHGASLGRYGDVGDYTPTNCRWITRSENSIEVNERRKIRMPDGRAAVDVAAEHGISSETFHRRRHKNGWSIERAATTPLITYNARPQKRSH